MKRVFLIIILILIFVNAGCTAGSSAIATINDKEIFRQELDMQMVLTEVSYNINGYEMPVKGNELEDLEQEMLNNVLESYMLVDLAIEKGIEIDEDAAVEQSESLIDGLISIYGSEENYENFLKEKGQNRKKFDEYIFELARTNEYIYDLYDEVTKDISVEATEIKSFYDENIMYYNYSTASVLGMQIEDEDTANVIHREILGKEQEYDETMLEYEAKTGVISVIDYGILYYSDMTKDFSDIAFNTNVGEISKPFSSEDAYFIIYVYDKEDQEAMPYDEIKDTVESDLLNEMKMTQYNEYFESKKSSYDIKIL
ncbi:hypothetical protein GC105_04105 [Alkalibaculum sp. M08DMB]|uniref:PpiC domain-containing protein n=1 Tax=Alkalibaculum sporogenes TaxID=2655001 RepID=A0A6A7K6K5_9FIRM|nr:peptidyl-prolyl cis-trans isomerase [Alkalibaculum sporogenes]MPW24971.1 hypothetical protein [Alkalibaculum sporogenes]